MNFIKYSLKLRGELFEAIDNGKVWSYASEKIWLKFMITFRRFAWRSVSNWSRCSTELCRNRKIYCTSFALYHLGIRCGQYVLKLSFKFCYLIVRFYFVARIQWRNLQIIGKKWSQFRLVWSNCIVIEKKWFQMKCKKN